MTADRIALTGLRGHGRHGWFDWEREQGQEFVVDVELSLSTAAAAASDDLADTVDYGAIASAVVALVEGEPVRLVETLAQRIADTCLVDPRVESVTVTVHKPQAPVQVRLEDVAVTVTRGRA
jgi:7,8-dihydroneopterin aldolase/epimerase/oxygenase